MFLFVFVQPSVVSSSLPDNLGREPLCTRNGQVCTHRFAAFRKCLGRSVLVELVAESGQVAQLCMYTHQSALPCKHTCTSNLKWHLYFRGTVSRPLATLCFHCIDVRKKNNSCRGSNLRGGEVEIARFRLSTSRDPVFSSRLCVRWWRIGDLWSASGSVPKAFLVVTKYKWSFNPASVCFLCSIEQPECFRSCCPSQQAGYIASFCSCSFSRRSFPVCCPIIWGEIPCVTEIGRCVHIVCLCVCLNLQHYSCAGMP